ncbi:ABC transporter ATP-binding protein [Arsenicicoccus dermatophilus]|uniref:ABC transporter ATP-binding protein n=1 Tax=Arsenicicoccus dermatophilus TaxID=1076331 RepID=UPI0039175834
MTTPAIELRDLRKEFRVKKETVTAVDGLDLTVLPGEVVAFLGPNGAGKTTTLDLVLGLTSPTSGTVRTYGGAPRAAVQAGRVGAVLQTGGLLDDLTVRETVHLVASTYRELALRSRAHVTEVVERAGLTRLVDRRVATCSGGEQQRLRFALALLPEPDLLILDEPTAGMDVQARQDFWATMHADAAAGRTVVFATHYLEEAEHFAQRIVLVARGRVVADGTVAELRARSSTRVVSADVDAADLSRVQGLLARTPGVGQVETVGTGRTGIRLTARCTDSDTLARVLLEGGARELEVSRGSLDQAFVDLTGGATADTPPADHPRTLELQR